MRGIVPAQKEDEAFLFELYCSGRREELLLWNWDQRMQNDFLSMQWTSRCRSYAAQYPNADRQLVLHHHQRVGQFILDRETREQWVLVDLAIQPEHQRQGHGTWVLRRLQDMAGLHCKPLRLSVITTNPAKRLYEQLGFRLCESDGLYDVMEWCVSR